MAQDIIVNFKPRSYQLDLFRALEGEYGKPETGKKRAILRWHRRAGKDKACWVYMCKKAIEVPGNYFYIFPLKTEAKAALWENVDKDGYKLINHVNPDLIQRINNQEMVVEFKSGSTIRILGSDADPNSIRGVACKGAIFSEFAFSDPEAYKVMIPALRESGGWAIFNSTPNGRNHFSELWERNYLSPNWYASLLQTYWPNQPGYSGLISPQQLEEVKNEEGYDDEKMETEYGCSFNAGLQGSIYIKHVDKAYEENRIGRFPYDNYKPVDTFWDLGRDGCAIWFRQKDGKALVFIDYWEMEKGDILEFVKALRYKGYNYGTHYLPWDADNKSIQTGNSTARILEDTLRDFEMSSNVVVLEKSPVKFGLDTVKKRFSRYHFNQETCADAIKHLELYHRRYDRKRQVFTDEPVHDNHSHCADALRCEAMSEDVSADYFYKLNNLNVNWDYDIFD